MKPRPDDAGQEVVDVVVADRVVEQVRASLVVEAHAGDGDVDAVDLTAAVAGRVQSIHPVAAELTRVGDLEAQQELGVQARYERDLERPDRVDLVELHDIRPLREIVELQQLLQGGRAVGVTAVTRQQKRNVEGVVEVGVTYEHGAGRRDVALDRLRRRADPPPAEDLPQAQAGQVGIDQEVMALVAQAEAGRSEPLQLEARGQVAAGTAPVVLGAGAPIVLLPSPRISRTPLGGGPAEAPRRQSSKSPSGPLSESIFAAAARIFSSVQSAGSSMRAALGPRS